MNISVKVLKKGLLAVFALSLCSARGGAAAIQSQASGPWSQTSSWSPAQVPTANDTVTIQAGHTITVDITTATASTTTIQGSLSFSRIVSSSLTLVGGNMTVDSGGLLDLGTEALPIPDGLFAHLVLSSGSSAGQYGLTISTGGSFSVRGSTKTPAAVVSIGDDLLTTENVLTLSADPQTVYGWKVGDRITIGPTAPGGGQTELKTIAAFPGGNQVQVESNFSRVHLATAAIQVANLTRNVLIRSSGTALGSNTAYVRSLAQSATSFTAAYGEFACFGGAAIQHRRGVVLEGFSATANISSSTFRDSTKGLFLIHASSAVIESNVFYANSDEGLHLLNASRNQVVRNQFAENFGGDPGLYGEAHSGNFIAFNEIYGNSFGYYSITAGRNLVYSNRSYSNGFTGMLPGSGDLFVANRIFHNQDGYQFGFGGYLSLLNSVYANTRYGLFASGVGSPNVIFDERYGYDHNGAPAPNNTANVFLEPAGGNPEEVILHGARIHPQNGVSLAGFNQADTYLLSYNQDFDTGTVRLWGDHVITGSTWTLDYSQRLYSSTHTDAVLLRGSGHRISSIAPVDAAALTELITVTATGGGNWRIEGSSSGVMDASFNCPSGNCSFNHAKVSFTLSPGSISAGDFLAFATMAASQDAGRQKKLLFGSSDPGYHNGRSRLAVAPSGGIVLRGASGFPTVMDRISSGSTYYMFVGSGAFTAAISSISNLDSDGLQLSGTGGVSISSTVFDFMGVAAATNAYITARALTSAANLTNVDFLMSRSSAGAAFAYNVLVAGADAGLAWTLTGGLGPFFGEAFDHDLNNKVQWTNASAPGSPSISAVHLTSVTVSFGAVGALSYVVEASTAADFTGTPVSSAGAGSPLAPQNLTVNTTYYVRAGAVWVSTTVFANASPSFGVTLASAPAAVAFPGIQVNGFAVSWSTSGNPQGTRYEARVSTDVNFGSLAGSSVTLSSFTSFGSLSPDTTYFFRVRAVNHAGTATSDALGAVVTTPGAVITISADRLAGLWYNTLTATFFAQGAGVSSFHYRINSDPNDTANVTAGDPVFSNGSTLPLAQGDNYFHVFGSPVGRARYGPIRVDNGSPTVASISAQESPLDPTPIADGGATNSSTPRFTWPDASSLSPVIGYGFSVSTNAADVPPPFTTLLKTWDAVLPVSGVYYARVAALNQTGTQGPVRSMSFTYSSVPAVSSIVLKNNYFNPHRGECASVVVNAASAGRVLIELYTLRGQKVASLASGDIAAGSHSFPWCGKNGSGNIVAAGAYLLRIEAPQQKKNMKMIVAN